MGLFGPETAKKFYPTIPKGKLKTESRITNKDFGTLYKVVSRHGLFGKHLSNWKTDIDDTCQFCLEEEETSWHLWQECVALEKLRGEIANLANTTLEEKIIIF